MWLLPWADHRHGGNHVAADVSTGLGLTLMLNRGRRIPPWDYGRD